MTDPDDATIEEARKQADAEKAQHSPDPNYVGHCACCGTRLPCNELDVAEQLQALCDIATRRGERIKEDNAVCICGCPPEAHEMDDCGESCADESHECLRVCVAVREMWVRRGERIKELEQRGQTIALARNVAMDERDVALKEIKRLRDIISPGDAAAYEEEMAALEEKNKKLREALTKLSWYAHNGASAKSLGERADAALAGGGE